MFTSLSLTPFRWKATSIEALKSPTTDGGKGFRGAFGAWVEIASEPISVSGPGPAVATAFESSLRIAHGEPEAFMAEDTFYDAACDVLPTFGQRLALGSRGDVEARVLFGSQCQRTLVWPLPRLCRPELHIGSRGGYVVDRGSGPEFAFSKFAPAVNGAIKTAGDKRALQQLVTDVLLDMTRIFFPATHGGEEHAPPTYFSKPPVGYGILATAHLGYWWSLEMLGKLVLAPASAPFFIGSAEHKAATAALPYVTYDDPLLLPESDAGWASKGSLLRDRMYLIGWTTRPIDGRFYKRVRGHAYGADFFRNMHDVYSALTLLLPKAGRPRALLTDVKLWYGAHEVLVDMPFFHGRQVTGEELVTVRVLADVAEAVVWFARSNVIYRDVRGANVLIDVDGNVVLVDYDDCFLVDSPVVDYDSYLTALRTRESPVTEACPLVATFSSTLLEGTFPQMEAALRTAFEVAAAQGAGVGDVGIGAERAL